MIPRLLSALTSFVGIGEERGGDRRKVKVTRVRTRFLSLRNKIRPRELYWKAGFVRIRARERDASYLNTTSKQAKLT